MAGGLSIPDVAVAVPDSDSKGSNCQLATQKPEGAFSRLSLKNVSAAELAELERCCSFFTDYANLPKSSRGYHRQREQDRCERAGRPGPDDVLSAALRKIAERRLEVESRSTQPELDFSAPTTSRISSQKIASVATGISALAGGGIDPKHLAEWVEGSGVDEELARLNLRSVSGDEVYRLLRPVDDGRDKDKDRYRLRDVLKGGWFCQTNNIFRGAKKEAELPWGCLKPDFPRPGFKKDPETGLYVAKRDAEGKPVPMKYEHPAKVPTQVFVLVIPRHIGEKIAKNHRLLKEYQGWENEKQRTSEQRWRWLLSRVPLWLTEGAKKTAALLTAGRLAVGLSGIWNGFAKKDNGKSMLKPDLKRLFHFGVKEVIVAFDWSEKEQGTIDVRRATERLCNTIRYELKDVSCKVSELQGPEKGCDDVLVAHGAEGIDRLEKAALTLRAWQAKNNYIRIAQRLNIPMSGDANRPERTIDRQFFQASDIPTEAKLVAVLGPMGTNKTGMLVDYAKIIDAPLNIVLHRRGLGGNCAQRFQLPFHNDGKLTRPWLQGRHREVEIPREPITDRNRNYWAAAVEAIRETEERGKVVVLDSSHAAGSSHLDPEACRGAVINLEEWDASCWHLFTSDTEIKSHRAEVLSNLTACLRNAKQVICSSAHLNDIVVSFLEKLLGTKAHVLKNTHKPAAGRDCYWHEKSAHWLEALESRLREGDNIFITTTAQKSDSVHAAKNLAKKISRDLKVPTHQILVVDANTTRTKDHDAKGVITDPSLLLNYRVVIATPCIETGVSVDDPHGHFDAVFSFNSGCTTPQAAVQAVGRVRSDIDRYVCIGRNGATVFGKYTEAKEVIRQAGNKASAQRSALALAGIAETDEPATCNENIETWGELVADHNVLAKEFDFSVRTLLIQEGYKVFDTECADEELARTIKDQLKEVSIETTNEECHAVSVTKPASEDEIESLSKSAELTTQQQQELEHAKVCRDYGVERADFHQIESHRGGAFQALRTELFLETTPTDGNPSELVRMLDGLTAMKRKGITKDPFLGDYVRAFKFQQIELLHEYGILAISKRGDEFVCNSDQAVQELHHKAKLESDRWRKVFNMNPYSWQLPRGFFQSVLEKLGYTLLRLTTQNTEGKRKDCIIDKYRHINRQQIKAHIQANITHRYEQALEDVDLQMEKEVTGEDGKPHCTEQQITVANYMREHDHAIDMIEAGFG